MNMLLWLSILVTMIAAAFVATVLMRHWKEIRLLDPETIREEKSRRARTRLIHERLDRRLTRTIEPARRWSADFWRMMSRGYRNLEDRLIRVAGLREAIGAERTGEDTPSMLTRARSFARDRKWAEAERLYLEILKIEERNLDAYRGIATLYLAQRQYTQAKETLHFLIRMHGENDAVYAGLAEIAEVEGDASFAADMRKKATEYAPKNPVRHAELASHFIKHGPYDYAWAYAKRASELEPGSVRFLELSVEAAILVRDRDEAEERLSRLRLVSKDRFKLQGLREKLDMMPL